MKRKRKCLSEENDNNCDNIIPIVEPFSMVYIEMHKELKSKSLTNERYPNDLKLSHLSYVKQEKEYSDPKRKLMGRQEKRTDSKIGGSKKSSDDDDDKHRKKVKKHRGAHNLSCEVGCVNDKLSKAPPNKILDLQIKNVPHHRGNNTKTNCRLKSYVEHLKSEIKPHKSETSMPQNERENYVTLLREEILIGKIKGVKKDLHKIKKLKNEISEYRINRNCKENVEEVRNSQFCSTTCPANLNNFTESDSSNGTCECIKDSQPKKILNDPKAPRRTRSKNTKKQKHETRPVATDCAESMNSEAKACKLTPVVVNYVRANIKSSKKTCWKADRAMKSRKVNKVKSPEISDLNRNTDDDSGSSVKKIKASGYEDVSLLDVSPELVKNLNAISQLLPKLNSILEKSENSLCTKEATNSTDDMTVAKIGTICVPVVPVENVTCSPIPEMSNNSTGNQFRCECIEEEELDNTSNCKLSVENTEDNGMRGINYCEANNVIIMELLKNIDNIKENRSSCNILQQKLEEIKIEMNKCPICRRRAELVSRLVKEKEELNSKPGDYHCSTSSPKCEHCLKMEFLNRRISEAESIYCPDHSIYIPMIRLVKVTTCEEQIRLIEMIKYELKTKKKLDSLLAQIAALRNEMKATIENGNMNKAIEYKDTIDEAKSQYNNLLVEHESYRKLHQEQNESESNIPCCSDKKQCVPCKVNFLVPMSNEEIPKNTASDVSANCSNLQVQKLPVISIPTGLKVQNTLKLDILPSTPRASALNIGFEAITDKIDSNTPENTLQTENSDNNSAMLSGKKYSDLEEHNERIKPVHQSLSMRDNFQEVSARIMKISEDREDEKYEVYRSFQVVDDNVIAMKEMVQSEDIEDPDRVLLYKTFIDANGQIYRSTSKNNVDRKQVLARKSSFPSALNITNELQLIERKMSGKKPVKPTIYNGSSKNTLLRTPSELGFTATIAIQCDKCLIEEYQHNTSDAQINKRRECSTTKNCVQANFNDKDEFLYGFHEYLLQKNWDFSSKYKGNGQVDVNVQVSIGSMESEGFPENGVGTIIKKSPTPIITTMPNIQPEDNAPIVDESHRIKSITNGAPAPGDLQSGKSKKIQKLQSSTRDITKLTDTLKPDVVNKKPGMRAKKKPDLKVKSKRKPIKRDNKAPPKTIDVPETKMPVPIQSGSGRLPPVSHIHVETESEIQEKSLPEEGVEMKTILSPPSIQEVSDVPSDTERIIIEESEGYSEGKKMSDSKQTKFDAKVIIKDSRLYRKNGDIFYKALTSDAELPTLKRSDVSQGGLSTQNIAKNSDPVTVMHLQISEAGNKDIDKVLNEGETQPKIDPKTNVDEDKVNSNQSKCSGEEKSVENESIIVIHQSKIDKPTECSENKYCKRGLNSGCVEERFIDYLKVNPFRCRLGGDNNLHLSNRKKYGGCRGHQPLVSPFCKPFEDYLFPCRENIPACHNPSSFRKPSSPTESFIQDISSEGEIKCKCKVSSGEYHKCPYAKLENYTEKQRDISLTKKIESNCTSIAKQRAHYQNWITFYLNKKSDDSSSTTSLRSNTSG